MCFLSSAVTVARGGVSLGRHVGLTARRSPGGYTETMAPQPDIIDSTFLIKTPENIGFRYGVAGPFRRLPAYLIDVAINLIMATVLFWVSILTFAFILWALFGWEGAVSGGALGYTLYLIGYFILLLGAGLALWQSGIMRQIPGVWLFIGALIAIGFGIMLAVASGRPAVTTRE